MDPKTIQSISKQVYRQFPEMNDIAPKVRRRKTSEDSAAPPVEPTYLLTYQTLASLPTGRKLSRWVRVVVNVRGKILKISTSR